MRRGFRVSLITLGCSLSGSLWSVLNLMTGRPLILISVQPFPLTLRCWVPGSEISRVRLWYGLAVWGRPTSGRLKYVL